MGWLEDFAEKFAKEEAEKKAKEDAKNKFLDRWHETVAEEQKSFMQSKLGPLVGQKTKDGRTISMNEDTLLADGQPLLGVRFWLGEHEEYDSDGCRWGNGNHYVSKHVIYYVKHKNKSGYDRGGPEDGLHSFYEEDIAHYLLQLLQ
jgi:hypothetical protein